MRASPCTNQLPSARCCCISAACHSARSLCKPQAAINLPAASDVEWLAGMIATTAIAARPQQERGATPQTKRVIVCVQAPHLRSHGTAIGQFINADNRDEATTMKAVPQNKWPCTSPAHHYARTGCSRTCAQDLGYTQVAEAVVQVAMEQPTPPIDQRPKPTTCCCCVVARLCTPHTGQHVYTSQRRLA